MKIPPNLNYHIARNIMQNYRPHKTKKKCIIFIKQDLYSHYIKAKKWDLIEMWVMIIHTYNMNSNWIQMYILSTPQVPGK